MAEKRATKEFQNLMAKLRPLVSNHDNIIVKRPSIPDVDGERSEDGPEQR